jgi:virginiamycin B lyase
MWKRYPPIVVAMCLATLADAAEVRYYPVPQGSRPHDVAPAPDGTVWYTSQPKGEVGRLDPKTGKVEQIPLGTGSSAPTARRG